MQTKLKKYRLNNKRIAQLFGYKNASSLNSSTAKEKLKRNIIKIIEIVENKIVNDITN